jgi:hypothetical protein
MPQDPSAVAKCFTWVFSKVQLQNLIEYRENATKSGFNLPHVRSKVTNGSNRKDKRMFERIFV